MSRLGDELIHHGPYTDGDPSIDASADDINELRDELIRLRRKAYNDTGTPDKPTPDTPHQPECQCDTIGDTPCPVPGHLATCQCVHHQDVGHIRTDTTRCRTHNPNARPPTNRLPNCPCEHRWDGHSEDWTVSRIAPNCPHHGTGRTAGRGTNTCPYCHHAITAHTRTPNGTTQCHGPNPDGHECPCRVNPTAAQTHPRRTGRAAGLGLSETAVIRDEAFVFDRAMVDRLTQDMAQTIRNNHQTPRVGDTIRVADMQTALDRLTAPGCTTPGCPWRQGDTLHRCPHCQYVGGPVIHQHGRCPGCQTNRNHRLTWRGWDLGS